VNKFINEEGLAEIAKGKTDFEMLFSVPELLPKLKAFGKILGPRGLMPNPKVGTLVNEK
jgi:large subunit ribosomal protein L1